MRVLSLIAPALALATSWAVLAGADATPVSPKAGQQPGMDPLAEQILAACGDPQRLAQVLWCPPPSSPALEAALNQALVAAGQVAQPQRRTLLLDLASDDLLQGDGVAGAPALSALVTDRVHEGAIALLTARHPRAYSALLAGQCASSTHGLAWVAATETALREDAPFLAGALLPQCRLLIVVLLLNPGTLGAGGAMGSSTSGDGQRELPADAPGDVLYLLEDHAEPGALVVATTPRLVAVRRVVETATGRQIGFGTSRSAIDDRELIWQELHLLARCPQPRPARQDVSWNWDGADGYVHFITQLQRAAQRDWGLLGGQLVENHLLGVAAMPPMALRVAVIDDRTTPGAPLPPIAGVESIPPAQAAALLGCVR